MSPSLVEASFRQMQMMVVTIMAIGINVARAKALFLLDTIMGLSLTLSLFHSAFLLNYGRGPMQIT